mgnify:CR=1 FL=1|jgi:hypothetical protein|tara:strand:- start:2333 stop:2914 length:582 start_codon:yes stop_codon:yes gene_type:complete
MKLSIKPLVVVTVLTLSGLVLSACSATKETFGLGKQSPDEFQVVARAPLTLPPNFQLRPPQPGAVRPQEGSAEDQARKAVFRAEDKQPSLDEVLPDDGRSRGERSLLAAAGYKPSDSNIRLTIERETNRINDENESFVEDLIFWRGYPTPGDVVDAAQESKRIREAEALGKPVDGNDVPTVVRKQKGLLEGIF